MANIFFSRQTFLQSTFGSQGLCGTVDSSSLPVLESHAHYLWDVPSQHLPWSWFFGPFDMRLAIWLALASLMLADVPNRGPHVLAWSGLVSCASVTAIGITQPMMLLLVQNDTRGASRAGAKPSWPTGRWRKNTCCEEPLKCEGRCLSKSIIAVVAPLMLY